jgi:hypothetical protein
MTGIGATVVEACDMHTGKKGSVPAGRVSNNALGIPIETLTLYSQWAVYSILGKDIP